ncbi:MAG: twin-arginine translocase subunit TatC [Planctomycetes bacterium]|nr:twin-arginine translocase subunit TatC [Planctomycetota bacterium]
MVQLDDPKLREALDEPEQLPRMSFGDHLDELRKRVIYSLLALLLATGAVMPFKGAVQEIILGPYRIQWRIGFEKWVDQLKAENAEGVLNAEGQEFLAYCLEHHDAIIEGTKKYTYVLKERSGYPIPYSLYATGGLEDILNYMWATLLFGFVIASPIIVWQIWAFIGAGLYKHERSVFYRYFPFMLFLAVCGVWFGYQVALPYSLGFLVSLMDPNQVGAIFSVGQYWSLLFMTTAAMGLVFQVPIVMLALQKVGLVRHQAFKKHWRMTIVVIAVLSAVFTPPEPVSMVLMMLPMVLLFVIGLVLTGIAERNRVAKYGPDVGAPA